MKTSSIIFVFFAFLTFAQVEKNDHFTKTGINNDNEKNFLINGQTVYTNQRKNAHSFLNEKTSVLITKAEAEGGMFWIDEKGDTIIATPYWCVRKPNKKNKP